MRRSTERGQQSPQEGWLGSGRPHGSCVLPLTCDVLPHGSLPGHCLFPKRASGLCPERRRQGVVWGLRAQTLPLPTVKGKLVCLLHQRPPQVPWGPSPVLGPHFLPALSGHQLKCHVPQGQAGGWWASKESCSFYPGTIVVYQREETHKRNYLISSYSPN